MNKWTGFSIFGMLLILGCSIYYGGEKFHNPPTIEYTPKELSEVHKKEEIEEYVPKYIEDRGDLIYAPMGDSLTAGYYASTKATKFTSVFAKMIEDKMGFSVTTDGVGNYGGKIELGLDAAPTISEYNPDIVTIEYGTNDSDPNNGLVTIESFEENLNETIEILIENTDDPPLIVLVTTWNQKEKAIPFDNVIKKVGKERGIPVADIVKIWQLSDTKGPEGVKTPFGESDNWHPNDKGMKLISEEIFKVASPYLDKQQDNTTR